MFSTDLPSALRPLFLTRLADQPLRLHQGLVAFSDQAGLTQHLQASTRLEWRPSIAVKVTASDVPRFIWAPVRNGGTSLPDYLGGSEHVSVRFPAVPCEIRALLSEIGSTFTVVLVQPVEAGVLQGFKSVRFHVPNFPEYIGSWITEGRGRRRWAGRVVFEVNGWRVTLDGISRGRHLRKRLSRTAGLGITHVGGLERVDRSPFGAQDTLHVLERLSFLFSFVRGAWTCCTLPVALGEDGQQRWAEWSAPRVARKTGLSWFSERHPESINALAPGFFARVAQEHWWDAITFALNCYYESNAADGMVHTAVVLEQTGLDTLAWAYFVEDGRASVASFDPKNASERIRMLLTLARVPLGIPKHLASLADLAVARGWRDGPQALTEVRHAIAHAKRKKPIGALFEPALVDCWWLGVWYLEMALLWLFDYSGEYESRLNPSPARGRMERVPWALGMARP